MLYVYTGISWRSGRSPPMTSPVTNCARYMLLQYNSGSGVCEVGSITAAGLRRSEYTMLDEGIIDCIL